MHVVCLLTRVNAALLAQAPSDFDILNGAVFLAQCLGHLDVAIALGEYLITLDPVNPTGYFRLIEQNPKGAFTIAYVLAYRGMMQHSFSYSE